MIGPINGQATVVGIRLKTMQKFLGRGRMLVSFPPIDNDQNHGTIPARCEGHIEATYRSVFENTGTATLIVDNDMTILKANSKSEQLFGYARKEIEGRRRWPEFVHPDYVAMMKRFHVARRTGESAPPSEYECRIITCDGRIRDIYMKVGMIPGTRRSILSFLDITERKQAEAALVKNRDEIRAIVDLIDGFVYTSSPDFKIAFMNRRLCEKVGVNPSDRHCYRVLHGLDAPCAFCAQDRVFQGETVRREFQSPQDRRWYYAVSAPLFEDGVVVRKQTVIIDITDRKQAEERLRQENRLLKQSFDNRSRFGGIIGACSKMQEVYQSIIKAAATDAPVAVYGESGTGKELVARAIHDMSPRKEKPFVVVNCGAIPPNLLESEFFGHMSGAFTGAAKDKKGYLEVAHGGTLFLDEIGEIQPGLQSKLLRAIEGGGFTPVGGETLKLPDVRIIAATNRDLQQMVTQGRMRSDFYYRIHVIPIEMPPLRQRGADLRALIDHFMARMDPDRARPIETATLKKLLAYHWPGNVRELQNVLHRFVTLGRLALDNDPAPATETETFAEEALAPDTIDSLQDGMLAYEKKVIHWALRRNNWHRSNTAASLGVNRRTLFKKMKLHGLD